MRAYKILTVLDIFIYLLFIIGILGKISALNLAWVFVPVVLIYGILRHFSIKYHKISIINTVIALSIIFTILKYANAGMYLYYIYITSAMVILSAVFCDDSTIRAVLSLIGIVLDVIATIMLLQFINACVVLYLLYFLDIVLVFLIIAAYSKEVETDET